MHLTGGEQNPSKMLQNQLLVVVTATTRTVTSLILLCAPKPVDAQLSYIKVESQFDHVDRRRSKTGGIRLIEIDRRISRLHCPATPTNPIHRDHTRAPSPGSSAEIIRDLRGINQRRSAKLDGYSLGEHSMSAVFHHTPSPLSRARMCTI